MSAIGISDVQNEVASQPVIPLPHEYDDLHRQIEAGLTRLHSWFPLSTVHVGVEFSLDPLGQLRPMWTGYVASGPKMFYQETLKEVIDGIDQRRKDYVDADEVNHVLRDVEQYFPTDEELMWLESEMMQ